LPAHKFHSLERLFEHPFLSTHASFRRHFCTFMQAGQRSGISRFVSNESSTIVSVLSPVEMAVPRIGQRIMILGKK